MFYLIRSGRYVSGTGEFVIERRAKKRGKGWEWHVLQWESECRDFILVDGWVFGTLKEARERVERHIATWSKKLI